MGFEIRIQKGLNEDDEKYAKEVADTFIKTTMENDGKFCFGGRTGGRRSYIRRGRFGYMPHRGKHDVTFRRYRIKKHNGNVIFCLVHADTMCKPCGGEIEINQCMCPEHRGGERVRWKDWKSPDMYVYHIEDY